MYFKRDVDGGAGEVWRVRQGGRVEPFLRNFEDPCEGGPAYVNVVRAFGEGGLAVGFECLTSADRIYVVDLRTRAMSLLLGADDIRDATLDASGMRGYVAQENGRCASVAGFSDGALRDLDVRVPSMSGEWRLSAAYGAGQRGSKNEGCAAAGKAVSPVLTADGRSVVMLVTTARAGGGLNQSLADSYDWQVGFLDGDADTVRMVGPVLKSVPRLAVSPDGTKVALERNGPTDGLLVMDVASGETQSVVADKRATDPAFSPDGRTIAYCSDLTSIKFVQVS
ncbi:TolB family protein [Dactylosporangium fulvum]|uniref:Uncharacterized protein n=1 Tax=Dactylosporangium fulvum TaxID=53359 RepID=A0ABY5VWM6_9ACTN|nr:hypothetical protein [Dactylosporangium fulvum]UWP81579.1 hypothetical protein Dfulv_41750 [Dactylosporangium fulvum]